MVSLGEDIKFCNFRFKEVTEALKILIIGHETERRYSTVKVITNVVIHCIWRNIGQAIEKYILDRKSSELCLKDYK